MVNLFVTRHSKIRLIQRYNKDRFEEILPTWSMKLYKDKYVDSKYYYNLGKNGFVVLKKVKNGFIIKTITKTGVVDDRDFIIIDEVIIVDKYI